MKAQSIILDCNGFEQGVDEIRDQLLSTSVRDYFADLLKSHGLQTGEVVRRADLDKDFGRQLIRGERMGRRDYYIRLAIGMSLTVEETQSMLSYLGIGPLYALRKRDAAIIYALRQGYSLVDTQLLLDQHDLTPLGDAEETFADFARGSESNDLRTVDVEQRLMQVQDFDTLSEEMNDSLTKESVNTYFSRLLEERGLSRRQLIDLAGLGSKANLVFQLLNGTRTARNRDIYIRLALALKLSLDETQSLLKFLKKGALYPLKMRDAALVFCLGRGYDIEATQQLLAAHDLPEL
jgi:transcriptional regulator with XRE-family HTH domain